MRVCLPRISLFLLAACVQLPAFAAQRGRAEPGMQQGRGALATSEVRPLVAPSEARAEIFFRRASVSGRGGYGILAKTLRHDRKK